MKKLKIKKQNEVAEKKVVNRKNKKFSDEFAVSYLYIDEGFQMLFPGGNFFQPVSYRSKKVKS